MSSFFSEKWSQVQQWLQSNAIQSVKNHGRPGKFIFTVLCVDDDIDFCNFMEKLASPHEIKLDKAFSIEEAKQKIEENVDYKAYIIDGHLPDGSGFELIAWIREKMGLEAPIGFLSRIYQDAVSFRILKDSLKVNYVLEKPIRPAEVNLLFKQLCKLETTPSLDEPFPDELLADIKETYEKSIYDKVERIEKMILEIQKNPTIENLQLLKSEVHKIAGSSGSYGYPKVSELCKKLESDLLKEIEHIKKEPLSEKWLSALDDFFTQLKMNFQVFHTTENEAFESSYDFIDHPSIYVVDFDKDFLSSIKEQKENLVEESDPEMAFKKLSLRGFITPFLLTRAHFPGHSRDGYDLIETYYSNEEEIYPSSAIMTDFHNTDEQVEAINRGVFFVFSKPFSIHVASMLLEQRPLTTSSEYKILVVDDDPDVSQYIEKSLTGMGMQVHIITDINQIEKAIEEINPNILLLDVDTVNGNYEEVLILLKGLKFKGIIYAMVTVSPRENFIERIYESNVDDILFKPLEGITLKRRLYSLYKKHLKDYSHIDNGLTELWSPSAFYDQALIGKKNSVLVVLEVKPLKPLDETSDKEIESQLLMDFRESLNELLKRYEYASYLGKGRFALIFNRLHLNYLKQIIKKFIARTEKITEDKRPGGVGLKIKSAFIPLSDPKLSLVKLKKQIDDGLNSKEDEAPDQASAPVKTLTVFSPQDQRKLKESFKNLGFDVKMALEEDLIDEIPSLIIIEGASAISRGSSLLKKIAMYHQIHMPVLYFPQETTAENLLNFITDPELGYTNSPFYLMIVVD